MSSLTINEVAGRLGKTVADVEALCGGYNAVPASFGVTEGFEHLDLGDTHLVIRRLEIAAGGRHLYGTTVVVAHFDTAEHAEAAVTRANLVGDIECA